MQMAHLRLPNLTPLSTIDVSVLASPSPWDSIHRLRRAEGARILKRGADREDYFHARSGKSRSVDMQQ